MRTGVLAVLASGIGLIAVLSPSLAAETKALSLKAGETVDVGNVYWVSACRSLLRGTPVAEIMEGPPEVTVTVRNENVVPRSTNCAKPVPGGIITVAAPKEVKARTEGRLTVRIKIPTLDGERQDTRLFDVILFP